MNRGKAVAFAALFVVVTLASACAGISFASGGPFASTGGPAALGAPLPRPPASNTAARETTTSTSTATSSSTTTPTLPSAATAAFVAQYEPAHLPSGTTPATPLPTALVCLRVSSNACTRVIGAKGQTLRRGNSSLTILTTYVLQPLTNASIRATLGRDTAVTPTATHGGIGFRIHSDAPGNRYDGYMWLPDATTVVAVTSSCRPNCASSFSDAEMRALTDALVARPLVLGEDTPHLVSFTTFDDGGTRRPFIFAAAPSADGECVGVVAGQDGDPYGTPDPNGFSCDTIDWDGQHRLFVSDDGSFSYGAVRGDVAQVRLEPKGAAPLTLTPGPAQINGGRAFAFPFDISTVDDYDVVALDATGRVLETWSSAANDFVATG